MDDHPAVRAGLERVFAAEAALNPVASAATASGAIARAHRLRPAVAVVDYRLPDRDGLSLTLELKRLPHPPRVVIYSAFAGTHLVLASIVAGADGFVEKGAGVDELRALVHAVAAGERAMPTLSAPALGAVAAQLGAAPEGVAQKLGIGAGWLEIRRWAIVHQLLGSTRHSSRERRIAQG